MPFHWEAPRTDQPDYRSQEFPTRADAEAWLTATYPDLVDEGVESVTLYQDADAVYGPMSLLA